LADCRQLFILNVFCVNDDWTIVLKKCNLLGVRLELLADGFCLRFIINFECYKTVWLLSISIADFLNMAIFLSVFSKVYLFAIWLIVCWSDSTINSASLFSSMNLMTFSTFLYLESIC